MADTGLGTKVKKVKRKLSKRTQYLDYVMDTQMSGGKAKTMKQWISTQPKD